MKRILLLLATLTAAAGAAAQETLLSPDGDLKLTFRLSDTGAPTYALDFRGRPAVLPSGMGLELRGDAPALEFGAEIRKGGYGAPVSLYDRFEECGVERSSFDETWQPVWGEESSIRNHYNEMAVTLRQAESGREMIIRFRLYDEGLGFRYEFPEQEQLTYFTIREERTQFAMTGDHTAFWIPGDYDTQEYDYTESRLSQIRSLMEQAITPNSSQAMSMILMMFLSPFSPPIASLTRSAAMARSL